MVHYKMIHDLFKISVWVKDLKYDSSDLLSHCLKLEQKENSDEGSLWGWKSRTLDSSLSCVAALHSKIQTEIDSYSKQLSLPNMKISTSWANVNNFKDFNMLHEHPGSVLSGVYYLSLPEQSGDIHFIHPSDKLSWAGFNRRLEYNNYNSEQWHINAHTGVLFIFPAWLKHFVSPSANRNEKRVSVSFNTIYS